MQREARAASDPHSHPGIHPSALQERRIATNTHTHNGVFSTSDLSPVCVLSVFVCFVVCAVVCIVS